MVFADIEKSFFYFGVYFYAMLIALLRALIIL